MADMMVGIKELIAQARLIAITLGSESLDGISTIREFQTDRLFISVDETSDRVWVAIPVWDEGTQEIVWQAVLDVPEDGFPERFLTNVTPDNSSLAWTDDIAATIDWINSEWEIVDGIRLYRYLRQLIGDTRTDITVVLTDLMRLQRMGLRVATTCLKLFNRLIDVAEDDRATIIKLAGG